MRLKTIARSLYLITISVALSSFATSCKPDLSPQPEYLDVTPFNLAGEWELVSLNGSELQYGTYFKITFNRSDKTYEYSSNLNTAKDYQVTGKYNIVMDEEKGAILRGNYDHDLGYWKRSYVVKDLTKDSMTWVSVPTEAYPDEEVRVYRK